MKKTVIALMTLVAAMMAVSCQKEADQQTNTFVPMVINAEAAGLGISSKIDMLYSYDTFWGEGDQIIVNDGMTKSDTFTIASGVGTLNGSFVQDGQVVFEGTVRAYYPSTIFDPMNRGSRFVWPSVQDDSHQVVPMYSEKTLSGEATEDFKFKSLGSVLQIVLTTTVPDKRLSRIVVYDANKAMSGPFDLDNGKAVMIPSRRDQVDLVIDNVAIGTKAKYFNIAVPSEEYSDLTVEFIASDGSVASISSLSVPKIEQNTVAKLILCVNKFNRPVLNSTFKVSQDGKRVWFSRGNLYGSVNFGSGFKFSEHQYEYKTYDSSARAIYGLFGWSVDAYNTPYGMKTSMDDSDYAGDFRDWGTFVFLYDSSNWRTLTSLEWSYLVNNHVYTWGVYHGEDGVDLTGLFIAPDSFTGSKLDLQRLVFNWNTVESEGILFLPAAGYRSGTEINYNGQDLAYWTSSSNGETTADVFYASQRQGGGDVVEVQQWPRHMGCAVRLVHDCF